MKRLVVHPRVDAQRQARIEAVAADRLEVCFASTPAEAQSAMPRARAFFGKLTPELLAAAPALEWVQAPTASLEHYLFPALVTHACQLTNMRGIYSDVIAEHVLAMMLCLARQLHVYVRQQSAREWAPVGGEESRSTFEGGPGTVSAMDRGHDHLAGKRLLIVGLGGIGRAVAQLAAALGMRIAAVDPASDVCPTGIEAVQPPADLPACLATCDWLVIAAPHTPATERLLDAAMLAHLPATARLVNVGRGAIVDLDALAEALAAGRLAGAALDVFETEPLPIDHLLWKLENVVLTPHVAGCAPPIAERHLSVLLENIDRFARGAPLRNRVDKQLWY